MWWSSLFGLLIIHIGVHAPKWITWQSVIGVGIVYLYIWYHALIEIELWRHEIYAVGLDQESGEGRVYKFFAPVKGKGKFWQVFNRSSIDVAILQVSPDVVPSTWWFYRLWGSITMEKMERVVLRTPNHGAWLEGHRISPDFYKAIKTVRASQPHKSQAQGSQELSSIHDIIKVYQAGGITHEEFGYYCQVVLNRALYGFH